MTETVAHDWTTALKDAGSMWLKSEVVEPFSYTRPDGSVATAAGNVYFVLRIEGQHTLTDPLPYKDRPKDYPTISGSLIDRVLAVSGVEIGEGSTSELRSLCGAPVGPLPVTECECEACDGYGEVECPHCGQDTDCEECDGSGRVDGQEALPPPSYVKIGSGHYDRRLLASILALVPDEPVKVAIISAPGNSEALNLIGNGWRVRGMNVIELSDKGISSAVVWNLT